MAGAVRKRRAVRWVATGLGIVALGYALQTLIPIVIWRSRWQPGIDALRGI